MLKPNENVHHSIEAGLWRLCFLASLVAMTAALVAAAGWLMRVPVFYQMVGEWPEMVPQTIVLTLALAGATGMLGLDHSGIRHRTVQGLFWGLVVFVALYAGAGLVSYYSPVTLTEFALFSPKPSSPRTSLSFLVLAVILALAATHDERMHNLGLYLLLLPFFSAMIAVTGYVSTLSDLYISDAVANLGMALPTAIAIVSLSVGVFLGPLQRCHGAILCSEGGGGALVRYLVPVIMFLPPAVCFLILLAAPTKDYAHPLVLALLTLIPSVFLGALVYYGALKLEKAQALTSRMGVESRQVSMALNEYHNLRARDVRLPRASDTSSSEHSVSAEHSVQAVAHNLRTPLAAIRYWLELLKKGGMDAAQVDSTFTELEAKVAELDAEISSVLGDVRPKKKLIVTGGAPAEGHRHQSQEAKNELAQPLSGTTILLVDDEDSIREAMKLLMEGYGAVVTTASNAEEARYCLRSLSIDLLLCDLGLPGEDGLKLISWLRNSGAVQANMPAIAVTGFTAKRYQEAAHEAGFDAFFSKPVSSEDLLVCMKKLLKIEVGKSHVA